jgi:hypothetical protein
LSVRASSANAERNSIFFPSGYAVFQIPRFCSVRSCILTQP